jgi:hypothetical protein
VAEQRWDVFVRARLGRKAFGDIASQHLDEEARSRLDQNPVDETDS